MAGITDLPFRKLVSWFGAGLVVSEMVASQEMVQERPLARARAELGAGIEGTAVQIAGREARWMGDCARICEGLGARIIDINMGCPAKKVTNGLAGSALMREPERALRLIEAVVSAVAVPVTLKMRLGWDADSHNADLIARRAAEAGVKMVTVHGRTRCQFYKGRADWAAIRPVSGAAGVPVIANGDIGTAEDTRMALHLSGADGVMVGRAARGRPWLLAQIGAEVFDSLRPAVPEGQALIDMIATHYDEMLQFYGPALGMKCARKHLGWYMDTLRTPAAQRKEVLTAPDPAATIRALRRLDAMPCVQKEAA